MNLEQTERLARLGLNPSAVRYMLCHILACQPQLRDRPTERACDHYWSMSRQAMRRGVPGQMLRPELAILEFRAAKFASQWAFNVADKQGIERPLAIPPKFDRFRGGFWDQLQPFYQERITPPL